MARGASRWLWPLALVAVGVGGMGGGIALGGRTATQPATTPIPAPTASVKRVPLSDTTSLNCTVQRDTPTLSVPAGTSGNTAIITKKANPSAAIKAGDVITEIAGRPVIALNGPYSLYRTLKRGDKGSDVTMLQEALAHFTDDVSISGTFDEATEDALEEFYDDRGYEAPTVPGQADAPAETTPDASASASEASSAKAADGATVGISGNQPSRTAAPAASTPKQPAPKVVASPSELVMVNSDALVLAGSLPAIGAKAPDPLLTYYTSAPYALCTSDRQAEIAKDAAVTFASPQGSGVVRGTQTPAKQASPADGADAASQGQAQGHDGAGASSKDAVLRVDFTRAPQGIRPQTTLTGQVALSATAGPVLAVPVSALHAGGTDSAVTIVVNGERREVQVTTGLLVDGLAQVTPTSGELHEGDAVLVGG